MDHSEIDERKRFLIEQVFSYSSEYLETNGVCPPYRLIGARFGRAFSRLGLGLRETLSADPRFKFTMSGTGAYSMKVCGAGKAEGLILKALSSPLDVGSLKDRLKGTGIKLGEFHDALDTLVVAGLIELNEDLYSCVKK